MAMIHDFRAIRPATGTATGTGTGFDRLLAQLATPPTRRTRALLRADTAKKARKLVEEATEVSLDAVRGHRRGVIEESVDLLYHLAVLWRDQGIAPEEIWAAMDRRAAVIGIAEKLPKKGPARKALKAALYRDGVSIGPVPLSGLGPAGDHAR
ncbi:MAG: phosphoribosyl-ATP diphosphatase [Alkalilacustris sp.]